jgi:predicted Zn-dependent protease
MKRILFFVLFILVLTANATYSAEPSELLKAAKQELQHYYEGLQTEEYPPYFISYEITDINSTSISATFGMIKSFESNKSKLLDIDLRVGDYEFDNTHKLRGSPFSFGGGRFSTELPLDDNVLAIKQAIWYATDRTFKKASEKYEKALTNKAVKVQDEDSSADFSREKPVKYFGDPVVFNYDVEVWKQRLKRLSAEFNKHDWIYGCNVTFTAKILKKVLVNTEGSELEWYEPTTRVYISARTKAEDGMNLPLYKSYFAFKPEDLPDEETMLRDLKDLVDKLKKLREAETLTTYSGPAILSGSAAGVFFHEIFGHRVEGHRQKDPNSAQTFKDFIGEQILPDFIDVVFDPHQKERNGTPLAGYYLYDDEGVEGQRVVTVKNGIFKGFLMSRSPIEGFPHSNGHGRKQAGYSAVSRQSNLFVISHKTVSPEKLKDMLREELKKQGKEFGLYFDQVQGGFTFTGTTIPNAFNVLPLLVYKIYADGRPDEVIRGVDLIGTPLTTFKNITATADDVSVFNGICGAESGGVPVSASSPSLLVSQIEAQKKSKSFAKEPILPAPKAKGTQ